jgi:hypothetical protein
MSSSTGMLAMCNCIVLLFIWRILCPALGRFGESINNNSPEGYAAFFHPPAIHDFWL